MNFYEQVYALVARIPSGRIVSYSQLSHALGMPNGARAVGWAMRHCPEGYPWHRVLNAGGCISAPLASERYTIQLDLLRAEGVEPDLTGKFSFIRYGWDGL